MREFFIEVFSKIPNIGKIHEDNLRYTIKITNIVGILSFLSYIYDESKIELSRKKEIYGKYREYRKSIESSYCGRLRGSYVKTS
jgi:hypothetical protein